MAKQVYSFERSFDMYVRMVAIIVYNTYYVLICIHEIFSDYENI